MTRTVAVLATLVALAACETVNNYYLPADATGGGDGYAADGAGEDTTAGGLWTLCRSDDDCDAGAGEFCAAPGAYCTVLCGPDTADAWYRGRCPGDRRCSSWLDGAYCFPDCGPGYSCPPHSDCVVDSDGVAACWPDAVTTDGLD